MLESPAWAICPRMKEIELPSRHLGLTLEAAYQLDSFSQRIADALVQHVIWTAWWSYVRGNR